MIFFLLLLFVLALLFPRPFRALVWAGLALIVMAELDAQWHWTEWRP